MDFYEIPDKAFSEDLQQRQLSITTQLLRAMATMHHVDEMFGWLAYMIVQRFEVQIAQLWTNQGEQSGRSLMYLQAMVRQDPSQPEQMVVNNQVGSIAQRLAYERINAPPQQVDSIFPQYQAILLKRYGLNYCMGCYNRSNLLPPQSIRSSSGVPPTSLYIVTLLFSRRGPHQHLGPVINGLIDQALTMAGNHGLLAPSMGYSQTPRPQMPLQQPVTPPLPMTPSLADLIPKRKEDPALLLSSNPFARTPAIGDKQARTFYAAIDGRTNVAGLCQATGLNIKEAYNALQLLVKQDRVELYEPGGRSIDVSSLLGNR